MDELVFGKNPLERVVSIESEDDLTKVFIRNTNYELEVVELPTRYWVVMPSPDLPKSVRLKGDLHYKWAKQFSTRDAFFRARGSIRGLDSYSIYNAKESQMVRNGVTYFKGMKATEPFVLSFDIETTTLEHNKNAKLLLISNTFRNNQTVERKLFCYDDYANEGELLKAWCTWVREKDPDVIVSHNGFSFDFPYLQYIANRAEVDLNLGRNGSKAKFDDYESKFRKDQTQDLHYHKVSIYGRELIDTLFLAIRYDVATKKYESYGLKPIIKQEGLENKNRVFYDASKIRANYRIPEEWAKIKDYAMYDADDSLALYDLMVPATFYFSQAVPKPFQLIGESATGSQLNSMMIRSYLQNGHSIPKASESTKFPGAISIGNPGIYSNCYKVDVASLYPSIMIHYEIYNREKDPEGNMLKILKTFTSERLKNKKLAKETGNSYYKDLEQSQKVGINSMYGFMGTAGLNFNYPEGAAEVTQRGREILNRALSWAKGELDE